MTNKLHTTLAGFIIISFLSNTLAKQAPQTPEEPTKNDLELILNDKTVTLQRYTGPGGDVVLPDQVQGKPITEIAPWAFWNRSDITSIHLGSKVEKIGERAFWFCLNLAKIEIPANLQEIGIAAFDDCSHLKAFTLTGTSEKPAFTVTNGILFTADSKKIIRMPEGSTTTEYTIPDTVEQVGNGAFFGCHNLQNLTVGKNVHRLAPRAFMCCSSITNLTLPEGLEYIGANAFSDCSNVTELIIPKTVRFMGDSSCSWINKMQKIRFEGEPPETEGHLLGHFVPNYPPIYCPKDAQSWGTVSWQSMPIKRY